MSDVGRVERAAEEADVHEDLALCELTETVAAIERTVTVLVEDVDAVTCHARASNENALRFYEHIGFEVRRRIDNYYEDGGDAYYLKLGDGGGLTTRLQEILRG